MARIIFLLTQSLDSPSGIGRYYPLAKQLVQLDHQVKIFALHPDFDQLLAEDFEVDGVAVHYVSRMHVRKTGDLKSYYSGGKLILIALSAAWNLSKAAIQNKSDVVIIGKPHPMNSIAGLISRFFHGCLLYLDCDDYEAGSGRFTSRWQKLIITWFEKWIPKRVNTVLTNTFFMRDKLIEWGVNPDKIHYLSNGVDASRFPTPPQDEVETLRGDLNLVGKKIAGYIGSMSIPSHPVNLLIDAIGAEQNSRSEFSFLFVGGGEDLPSLKAQANELGISNSIQFTGRIPPEQIPLYYSLLDVSVDPVYDDDAARGRSPLKLFESWFCGVPFVTCDVGDRRSLLGDPPAGALAKAGDSNSIASQILEILNNDQIADRYRKLGYERVKFYTWENLAQKLNVLIAKSTRDPDDG